MAIGPQTSGGVRAGGKPTAEARQQSLQRVAACQPMVRSIAWQLRQRLPRSVEVDELIGEGQLGLLRADRDYDASKGAQFSTYAYWRIRGAMLDWARQQDWYSAGGPQSALLAEGEDAAEGDAGESRAEPSTVRQSGDVEDEAAVDPSDTASEDELRTIVRGLVGNLSGKSKQILEATLLNGQTLEQAGKAAGVHKGTAQRAQVRAFDELAAALKDKGLSELDGPDLRRAVLKAPVERRAKPP